MPIEMSICEQVGAAKARVACLQCSIASLLSFLLQARVIMQQLVAAAADTTAIFTVGSAVGALGSMLASKDSEMTECIIRSNGE